MKLILIISWVRALKEKICSLRLCSLLQTQNFSQDVLSLTGKPDEVSVQLEGSVLSAPVEEVVVVAQLLSCQTLCDPMDYNKPGFPVLYYIP